MIRRVDGSALVEGANSVIASETMLTFTIERKSSEVIGWMFYAVASC